MIINFFLYTLFSTFTLDKCNKFTLRIHILDTIDQVKQFFTDNIHTFKDWFGVLLLLYSVVCTKGIAQMKSEISDLTDPLIHSTFGYGSQSLINLMLSGRAVNNVWYHSQNVYGLGK